MKTVLLFDVETSGVNPEVDHLLEVGAVRWSVTRNHGILFRVRTTKPTTNLTKGELLLLFHGSTPKLAVCISTASDALKMIRLRTKTIGRLTA